MDDQTLEAIVDEITPQLIGRSFARSFQLSRAAILIDFRRPADGYLLLNIEPAEPRIHMARRSIRETDEESKAPSAFTQVLRKQLGGATLSSISKHIGDRIVRFGFDGEDEIGNVRTRSIIAQLTGRTANLFLLDEEGRIIDALRHGRGGEGQQVGETYQPPPPRESAGARPPLNKGKFDTLSEAADSYYTQLEKKRKFEARATAARERIRKAIDQRQRLKARLEGDLRHRGNSEEHKRKGDLLLANLSTAEREGEVVTLTDYYAENAPRIKMQVAENLTLQEQAAIYFKQYAKSKRAGEEIARRLLEIDAELNLLGNRQALIEEITANADESALERFVVETGEKRGSPKSEKRPAESVPGARRYQSSDGYEILVGRAAKDNDNLTFRIAKSNDLWLHAADYPGSHVVVRNPGRAEVPQRTMIEAAQLAAYYSQARKDSKVNVHYTSRKYLSKPKRSAPGLVRMSSFRSITVEPRESVDRI